MEMLSSSRFLFKMSQTADSCVLANFTSFSVGGCSSVLLTGLDMNVLLATGRG